jgi:hypothetical protein
MDMLEYTKLIIKKISFDEVLFRKELKKSLRWLNNDEILALRKWLIKNFNHQYSHIIEEIFISYQQNPLSTQ